MNPKRLMTQAAIGGAVDGEAFATKSNWDMVEYQRNH